MVRNLLGVKGRVGALGWGLWWVTSRSIIHTNQTTSWLVCNWNTFDAQMRHGQTWIHKIHHGPDLGEAITFPLIIFYVLCHMAYTQMSFCPGIPKLRVLKFSKLGLLQLWRPITSCENLWLKWDQKQSYSPCQNLFNDMWHTTCT